jgi:hypothetical protein
MQVPVDFVLKNLDCLTMLIDPFISSFCFPILVY